MIEHTCDDRTIIGIIISVYEQGIADEQRRIEQMTDGDHKSYCRGLIDGQRSVINRLRERFELPIEVDK